MALNRHVLLTIPAVTSYHTFLSELVTHLQRCNWRVSLACDSRPIQGFNCHTDPFVKEIRHVEFPRSANPIRQLGAARRLRRLVRELKPGILHCHFSATALTVALAGRDVGPLRIATIQGLLFPAFRGLRRNIVERGENWAYSRLDGIWVLTDCDSQALYATGFQKPVFVQESYGFGCRLDVFDRSRFGSEEQRQLRQELNVDQGDVLFSFIGRQVDFKGFPVVVRAFLGLRRRLPCVKLLLIGTRDPRHKTGLTATEEFDLNSCPDVRSVGWRSNVERYLSVVDINVFPSQREGMPVNLMEALAMGVPSITCDSRGCRDVVRAGIDGLVLNDCGPDGVAVAMELLARDKVLRRDFAENAIKGRDRFDRNRWLAEQTEIYDRLLRRRAGLECGWESRLTQAS